MALCHAHAQMAARPENECKGLATRVCCTVDAAYMTACTGPDGLTMTAEMRLAELVRRWEDCRRRGQDVTVEQLCGDSPELVAELRQRIGATPAVPSDRA